MTVKLKNGPIYTNATLLRTESIFDGIFFKKIKTFVVVTLILDNEPTEVVWSIEDIEYIRPN